jgi:hypothetical protein
VCRGGGERGPGPRPGTRPNSTGRTDNGDVTVRSRSLLVTDPWYVTSAVTSVTIITHRRVTPRCALLALTRATLP